MDFSNNRVLIITFYLEFHEEYFKLELTCLFSVRMFHQRHGTLILDKLLCLRNEGTFTSAFFTSIELC